MDRAVSIDGKAAPSRFHARLGHSSRAPEPESTFGFVTYRARPTGVKRLALVPPASSHELGATWCIESVVAAVRRASLCGRGVVERCAKATGAAFRYLGSSTVVPARCPRLTREMWTGYQASGFGGAVRRWFRSTVGGRNATVALRSETGYGACHHVSRHQPAVSVMTGVAGR